MFRDTHSTICLVLLYCVWQTASGFAQERTVEARYDSETLQVTANALVDATPLALVVDAVQIYNAIPGVDIPIHGDAPDNLAELDQVVLDYMNDQRSTGLSIAITRGERLVYCKAFGYRTMDFLEPLSADHRLRLGSVSKILTSAAALRLFEEVPGVDMDTPVFGFTSLGDSSLEGLLESTDWITAMANQVDDFGGFLVYHSITPRHLMAHASGFNKTNESAWGGLEIVSKTEYSQAFLANCPLNSIPGTNCDYENQNIGLVGVLIEELSGQPYKQFVDDHILEPLQLPHITTPGGDAQNAWMDTPRHVGDVDSWDVEADHFDPLKVKGYPAGGWLASPRDFAKFLCALDTSGLRPNILATETIDEMKQEQFVSAFGQRRAIGWRIDGNGKLAHGGSVEGGHAYAAMYPADHDNWTTAFPDPGSQYSIAPINVVIAVNCDGESSDLAGLSDQVAVAVAQADLPTNIDYFEPFKVTLNEFVVGLTQKLVTETIGTDDDAPVAVMNKYGM